MSLRADCLEQIELLHAQLGTSQQRAALRHLDTLPEAVETLKYLSEHSKAALRPRLMTLREVLHGA